MFSAFGWGREIALSDFTIVFKKDSFSIAATCYVDAGSCKSLGLIFLRWPIHSVKTSSVLQMYSTSFLTWSISIVYFLVSASLLS